MKGTVLVSAASLAFALSACAKGHDAPAQTEHASEVSSGTDTTAYGGERDDMSTADPAADPTGIPHEVGVGMSAPGTGMTGDPESSATGQEPRSVHPGGPGVVNSPSGGTGSTPLGMP